MPWSEFRRSEIQSHIENAYSVVSIALCTSAAKEGSKETMLIPAASKALQLLHEADQ